MFLTFVRVSAKVNLLDTTLGEREEGTVAENLASEGGRSDLGPWLYHFYPGITLGN